MSSRHSKEALDDDDDYHDEDNDSSEDEFQEAVSTLPIPLNNGIGQSSSPPHPPPTGLGLSIQHEDTAEALPAMDTSSPQSAEDPQQAAQLPQQSSVQGHDVTHSAKLADSPAQDDIVSTPPFWAAGASPSNRHSRSVSYHSIPDSNRPAAILLEDHSEGSHQQWRSCWAQSVSVDDHVLVSGPTGIGAYVVWHCTVRTLEGGDLELRKRYSDFDRLHTNLVRSFPHAANMIPDLPRKSVVSRFRPEFLESRRRGLQHFLNCILLNPEFASSPVLKEFVFS